MKPGCRRLGTLAAFAALLATTISAGPTAATVSPVTMDITIGYDCVEGDKGFLPSVTLTLKHADGSVIDTGNDSNPSPNFAVCFSHQVHIGDKVLADIFALAMQSVCGNGPGSVKHQGRCATR